MTEISEQMVESAARSLCKEDGQDPDQYRVRINGPRWHYYRSKARAALTAALAVRESTHVWVPRKPTAAMLATFHDTVQITVYPDEKAASVMNDKEVWTAMISASGDSHE